MQNTLTPGRLLRKYITHTQTTGLLHYFNIFKVLLLKNFRRDVPSGSSKTVFPGDLYGKESACNAGDLGLLPVSGRSPG